MYKKYKGQLWSLFFIGVFFYVFSTIGRSYPFLKNTISQLDKISYHQWEILPYFIMGISFTILVIGSFLERKDYLKKLEAKLPQEKWYLALSAIYIELSEVLARDDIDSFYRIDMTRMWYWFLYKWIARSVLHDNWGIVNHDTALQTLHDLLTGVKEGTVKHEIAWDGVRFSHVARLSCIHGYLTPEEVWDQHKKIAPLLQKEFTSWIELNTAFIEGRKAWGGEGYDMDDIRSSFERLRENMKSPWNTLDWQMKL